MTLLGAMFRASLEDPQVPVSSAAIGELFGAAPTFAGVTVTEDRAYGLTAYFRGVAVLASTMAQLPLKVYEQDTRERVRVRTVLDRPNPAQTEFEFRQTIAANAITWGTGYARKVRDGGDVVVEVWSIHPSACRMRVVKPTPGNPQGRIFEVTDLDGTERELTAWEITAFPYLSPWGSTGLRPLQLAKQVLGVNIAAEETAAKFFGKGTMLGGILRTKNELTDAQAQRLKRRWQAMIAGQSNAGEIAVLDNEAEFVPVTIPPADAELLASRKFGVAEVARLLGVPPHLLMDLEKSTSWGSGIEQQTIGLVTFTLNGWLKLFEQRITAEWLPRPNWYAEHDTEGLLRGDSTAQAQYDHQAITDGLMTKNEIRARRNLPPVEGGDAFMIPSNMALVLPTGEIIPASTGGMLTVGENGELVLQGGGGRSDGDAEQLARILQKIYLSVGSVITQDEARAIVNRAGADLPIPAPTFPATPAPDTDSEEAA